MTLRGLIVEACTELINICKLFNNSNSLVLKNFDSDSFFPKICPTLAPTPQTWYILMEKLPTTKNISEEELLELAKKELLRDVKCASIRAEQFGAHSWAKPQKYVPNKRFLRHMLVSTLRDNRKADKHLEHNKLSEIKSKVSYQSHKHDKSSQRNKAPKKQSKRDISPDHSKLTSSRKSSDKEKKSHYHHRSKIKSK